MTGCCGEGLPIDTQLVCDFLQLFNEGGAVDDATMFVAIQNGECVLVSAAAIRTFIEAP